MKTPHPYSESAAEFMDMAGQQRPKQLVLPLDGVREPSPGDLGTLAGLESAMEQMVARVPSPVLRLRMALLFEEVRELAEASLREDMPMIARNVADVLYVAHSFPHALGYDGDAVYECVHGANMTKRRGKVRSDGKQLQPVDFKPPDVAGVLRKARG